MNVMKLVGIVMYWSGFALLAFFGSWKLALGVLLVVAGSEAYNHLH